MSQINLFHGYPDRIGKRFAYAGTVLGPKSYATGGDPITLPNYGFYIDSMHGALSVSGTYYVRPVPSAAGPRATWKIKWIVVSSGLEVAAAVDLSGETMTLDGLGGVY